MRDADENEIDRMIVTTPASDDGICECFLIVGAFSIYFLLKYLNT